jgi:hypothetical protein
MSIDFISLDKGYAGAAMSPILACKQSLRRLGGYKSNAHRGEL